MKNKFFRLPDANKNVEFELSTSSFTEKENILSDVHLGSNEFTKKCGQNIIVIKQ